MNITSKEDNIPPKRIVILQAIIGFIVGLGAAISTSAIMKYYGTTPKSTFSEAFKKAVTDSTNIAIVSGIVCSEILWNDTKEHNKRVDEELAKQKADSHAQRYEQEKLANSQSSQTQGR